MEGKCSTETDFGGSDTSNFGKPLPWIGMYIAGTSLICAICMAADVYRSFRRRKVWIAAKFFSFHSATLTLLAVATKIPSDITGPMPGLIDQLSKLTGLIFFSIALTHAMPSLGVMDGISIFSNMVAIGIVVITLFVNIQIQTNTGLITEFATAVSFSSLTMFLVFCFMVSHSLTVPTTRRLLMRQYNSLHEEMLTQIDSPPTGERLRGYLCKYWLMALTSSPDYSLKSSELSSVSAFLNWFVVSIVLVVNAVAVVTHEKKYNHQMKCLLKSDYSWSVGVVFVIQVVAIVIGSVTLFLRGPNSINPNISMLKSMFKVKKYHYQLLLEWRDSPLPVTISGRKTRKMASMIRNFMIDGLIVLQFAIIIAGNLVLVLVSMILVVVVSPVKCLRKLRKGRRTTSEESSNGSELVKYVLHLEEKEQDSIQSKMFVERWHKYPSMWVEIGAANLPENLYKLLRNHSTIREGFRGLEEARLEVSAKEPPICWALPLVTLASITYSVSDTAEKDFLSSAISEGLKYVRLIDTDLGQKGSIRTQRAAEVVWEGIYLHGRWLDLGLDNFSSNDLGCVVLELREESIKCLQHFQSYNPHDWPLKTLAANSMYKITERMMARIKQCHRRRSTEWLLGIVADVLGACLTNLGLAIFMHCSSGTFGLREEKVREAAVVLGEVNDVLEFLDEKGQPEIYPEKKELFENWCHRDLDVLG